MKRFSNFILEAEHPFRYAYKIDNEVENRVAHQLYSWVEAEMGIKGAAPEFWIVGHSHMQDAAQKVTHFNSVNGHVFGWFTSKYPEKVFISDRIKLANSKQARGVVVHEIVHYMQFHHRDHNSPTTMEYLEAEADKYMDRYMAS